MDCNTGVTVSVCTMKLLKAEAVLHLVAVTGLSAGLSAGQQG